MRFPRKARAHHILRGLGMLLEPQRGDPTVAVGGTHGKAVPAKEDPEGVSHNPAGTSYVSVDPFRVENSQVLGVSGSTGSIPRPAGLLLVRPAGAQILGGS
jgi:hypothetical protein